MCQVPPRDLVSRGGNPAVTGGALPIQLPLVISVTRGMNKIPEMCTRRGVLIGQNFKFHYVPF